MTGPPDEAHTLRGAIDRPALLSIRDIIDEMEPLATPRLDDYLNPSVLEISLSEGLCDAEEARIDVQWTTEDDYTFHYTDDGNVNCRWDNHPHGGDYIHVSGTEHYHPPPEASADPADVLCTLVTRAVLKLWRVAYHTDSYMPLNAGSNPP